MLRTRIVTALVLMAFLVPALLAANPLYFAALTLVMIAAAGWEWGRLNQAGGSISLAIGAALAGTCGVTLGLHWQPPAALWWCAAAAWLLGGAWALRAGVAAWPRLSVSLRWAIGLMLLWLAWLALTQARARGVNFILSVFCLVWVADIAAYAGGRAFGRRKLAPSISPGKSWEGVASGMLGVLVLAFVWLGVESAEASSFYGRLQARFGTVGMVLAVLALAGMSVVGDLFESLVKRAAGAKDSSGLLPGHGGVLDRVDALLPVFPIALALVVS